MWDTLAIGEFLNEIAPKAGLLPKDKAKRAHCRSVCGEMHSGFVSLRQALPMNIRAEFPGFKIWSKAQADIERILVIWRECLAAYGGPFLFGELSMADAMYAPVVSRFRTYGVALDGAGQGLRRAHLGPAGDARMARGGAGGEGRDRRARSRVLQARDVSVHAASVVSRRLAGHRVALEALAGRARP